MHDIFHINLHTYCTHFHTQLVLVRDHRCGDVIEALNYSAGFEDICVHCAATADLVKVSESSYPMCSANEGAYQKKEVYWSMTGH